MMRLSTSIALLIAMWLPAKADRPVTDAERARLQPLAEAQGCTVHTMEWDEDDQEFEVDAVCDGREHELTFDKDFKLVRKELD
jgi:hypothetical protein